MFRVLSLLVVAVAGYAFLLYVAVGFAELSKLARTARNPLLRLAKSLNEPFALLFQDLADNDVPFGTIFIEGMFCFVYVAVVIAAVLELLV